VALTLVDAMADLVLRIALALLFTLAALHKLRDRRRFDGIVLAYRLGPPRLVLRAARLLPALEGVIAAGLIFTPTPAAVAAATLFAGYGLAMTINLARGRRDIDCGCGEAPERLSGWLVARNAVLAAAALSLLLQPT
jgi:Methylamine utilisation protein MauE